jgi:hypothetical protein
MSSKGLLKPGWLQEDISRATKRLREWSDSERLRGGEQTSEDANSDRGPVEPDAQGPADE